MTDDPILADLYRFREELAERFNYDIDAIVTYLREKQAKQDRPIVSFSPRRIEPEESRPEKKAA